jgi:hypothetical protein
MAPCISGSILARLKALRGPGEGYSDVILRVAPREGAWAILATASGRTLYRRHDPPRHQPSRLRRDRPNASVSAWFRDAPPAKRKPRRANVGSVIYFGGRSAALPMFHGRDTHPASQALRVRLNVLGVSSGWRAPAFSARATRTAAGRRLTET